MLWPPRHALVIYFNKNIYPGLPVVAVDVNIEHNPEGCTV